MDDDHEDEGPPARKQIKEIEEIEIFENFLIEEKVRLIDDYLSGMPPDDRNLKGSSGSGKEMDSIRKYHARLEIRLIKACALQLDSTQGAFREDSHIARKTSQCK